MLIFKQINLFSYSFVWFSFFLLFADEFSVYKTHRYNFRAYVHMHNLINTPQKLYLQKLAYFVYANVIHFKTH